MRKTITKYLVIFAGLYFQVSIAFAEAQNQEELGYFLDAVGSFLIQTVGPGILVIGIAVAGISMALGNEQGMHRGALAAGGGALIMLARAILDLIKNVTGF